MYHERKASVACEYINFLYVIHCVRAPTRAGVTYAKFPRNPVPLKYASYTDSRNQLAYNPK